MDMIQGITKKNKMFKTGKYLEYLPIYEKYFMPFKRMSENSDYRPKILEIGVKDGGSLELYNDFFLGKCDIYGVDLTHKPILDVLCDKYKNIKIYYGDQGEESFWDILIKELPEIDIIIDDGSHQCYHQIFTFNKLFADKLSKSGVYICEDTHTSYWTRWGGGFKQNDSFIEFAKNFIDILHVGWLTDKNFTESMPIDNIEQCTIIRKMLDSVSFYDSIVVFQKKQYNLINDKIKDAYLHLANNTNTKWNSMEILREFHNLNS